MSLIWELIEVTVEGFGDASAVRISCYLAENFSEDAHSLSRRVVLLTVVLAFSLHSILLMAGPNIVVAITNDWTMQNIMENMIGVVGLAAISLALAQIYWNLLAVQGEFSTASIIIVVGRWGVIMPMALACIFGFKLAPESVIYAISVGYITSAVVLAVLVYRTDWRTCTAAARENFDEEEEPEDGFDPDLLDDESSDDEDL
jgi:Na+-driven multidrug efflux pump